MSYPTTLSPWYVVYRPSKKDTEYYRSPEGTTEAEDKILFTESKRTALLFTHLQSAARVATSEGARIRVLVTREEAEEFGRG